jgi:polar amino acid transport system permease protein
LFEALAQPLLLRGLLFLLSIAVLAGFDYGGLVARLAEVMPALAMPAGQAAGPWLVVAVLAALVVLNFWLLSFLPFRAQVTVIWVELLALFAAFCWSFDLNTAFMLDRTPILLGLELRDGFIQGAALTLFICAVSTAISTVIALAAALARLSHSGPAFGVATFYISFFRGTPLLLQIMLIYLGLPQIGLVIDAIPAGIIALSLCYGAYMAEIFRAGILAVPKGQSEAALSLGLKQGEVMWLVVLPQAMRLIIPPTGNQFIAMLKDSSLVSVMGVWEIMFLARTHGRAEFKYMEMLIVAALIYWAMSAAFELVQARIEKRFGKGVTAR